MSTPHLLIASDGPNPTSDMAKITQAWRDEGFDAHYIGRNMTEDESEYESESSFARRVQELGRSLCGVSESFGIVGIYLPPTKTFPLPHTPYYPSHTHHPGPKIPEIFPFLASRVNKPY